MWCHAYWLEDTWPIDGRFSCNLIILRHILYTGAIMEILMVEDHTVLCFVFLFDWLLLVTPGLAGSQK